MSLFFFSAKIGIVDANKNEWHLPEFNVNTIATKRMATVLYRSPDNGVELKRKVFVEVASSEYPGDPVAIHVFKDGQRIGSPFSHKNSRCKMYVCEHPAERAQIDVIFLPESYFVPHGLELSQFLAIFARVTAHYVWTFR